MILDTASTAYANRVGVQITDNEVQLEGNQQTRFVGLYQNGVSIGTLLWYDSVISYNGTQVLDMATNYSGYTLGLRLRSSALPNGDYEVVIRYPLNSDGTIFTNYTIPITVAVTWVVKIVRKQMNR